MFFKIFWGAYQKINILLFFGGEIHLKKVICIVLFVLMCLCLGGCNENNFPTAAYGELASTVNNAHMALVKSDIEDVASFRTIMHELAYTIDRDRHYEISFLYEDFDDEDVYQLDAISGVARRMNENEYRKELEANLTTIFLDTLQSDQSTVSDHGNLHSAILRWQTKSLFGKTSSYAICDFDGDGVWDYGVKKDGYPLIISFSSGSSDESLPKQKINEYHTVSLSCDEEIVKLKGLSGNETMSDFEQLL